MNQSINVIYETQPRKLEISKKLSFLQVTSLFSLIAVSGFPYFYRAEIYLVFGFLITAGAFAYYKQKISKQFIQITLLFLIIEIIQYAVLGGFNWFTFIGTYLRLLYAYMVVKLLKDYFFSQFVKIIYTLSVISLIFYIGSFIPGSKNLYSNILAELIPNPFQVEHTFYDNIPNFVIFTFHDVLFSMNRNPGPFWEPGAFAIFLMLGLIFNYARDKKITSKINLVFIICILTTISTTGYLCLFIFLIYINLERMKKNPLYIFLFAGIFLSAINLYQTLPFLQEKIESNIETADESTSSRFGSMLADFELFIERPIIGYGRAGAKRGFDSNFEHEHHRNNGIFALLTTYGLPITLIYLILIFNSFKKLSEVYNMGRLLSVFSFIILLTLGFSQGIFTKVFFYAFLFIPSVLKLKTANYD